MPPADRAVLENAWTVLLQVLKLEPGNSFQDIANRYSARDRHYHNLAHVGAVLATVMALGSAAVNRRTLTLAAWLHDIVYDPRASDNEERSADYARDLLGRLRLSTPLIDETARLILLTKTHCAEPGDTDGGILIDADLAIFSATESDYDAYVAAIRQEYAWVPETTWSVRRAALLETYLRRPRIYTTAVLFDRGEAQARRNLQREQQKLTSR